MAAVDAVDALSGTVQAFVALEELLEVGPGSHASAQIDRETVGALLSILTTRLFVDVRAAETAVRGAFHHCQGGG